MGGEFLEGFSYFGTELSAGLDPLPFHYFFFYFSYLYFEKWVIILLEMEEIIKGLG